MTVDEFLVAFEEKVKADPRKWHLGVLPHAPGSLRLQWEGPTNHCPLSYVAETTPCVINEARLKVGMEWADAQDIANAADFEESIYGTTVELRRRLLEIVGLS